MKRKYLFSVSVILMAIIINVLLYNYNNKYQHDDMKAAYGTVDYTDSKQDIHFLSEGWQIYLNEDQITHLDDKKPTYVSGIYKPLDVNKAIYRLQIINDKPDDFYTFIIPEVFSEYDFYINGQLIYKQDFIQNQQIHVNGETELDCILVVRNQNHYYSGQVFPIIFGESNAVINMHNLQNYSHSLLIFISLLSSIIMVTIYIFVAKHKKYLYAAVFSLFLSVYLSHYFIHQFIPVSSVLTYISEDISYYMTFIILFFFIYQFYCERHLHKLFIISLSTGILFCCLLPYIFIQNNHIIYYIGLFLKLDIALLFIYTLFKNKQSSLLYYCILFFIISYSFDFIYNFEPIYFGWNTEIAATILLIAYNIDIIQTQIRLYKKYSVLKTKTDLMIEYTHTKAHDLKAPVATMQGYIDLLSEKLDSEERAHILEKLKEKVSVLTIRMNQLQNHQYETIVLNVQRTNLKNLLSQVILEFQNQIMNKNIKIESDFIDIDYSIDSYYFKVVIENLIMNALEHTYEKMIFLKLYQTRQTIVIEIINYGDIIPQQQLTDIFEQGFSTKGLSRGYGLYISKKIVLNHNGTLSVISDKENGTCFIITLPIQKHLLFKK